MEFDLHLKKRLISVFPMLIFIIGVTLLLLRQFVFFSYKVSGVSMENSLFNNDKVLINHFTHSIEDLQRFDIVVVNSPLENTSNKKTIIKRVVGLPGDIIEYKSQQLYINGLQVKDAYSKGKTADFSLKNIYGFERVPNDTIFVLGDNREESLDSRFKEIGFISLNNIEGKVVLRCKPFNKFMKF
ncbi:MULTISPECIES: signal peptidase I [Bacillus cereus group]|uniref:signal peptidase I n=1 Tax=Bacillus cereus group TaxID=86661 RepID=UPI001EEEFAC4|nr:signal peptidase I [Bacillus cereus]HDR7980150.1 signal peptidase I [Bacillus cereus]HDR8059868.1 signal peptidase I [Bacillus cereus]HDR8220609.1 signal peptidase I [Bacillus cereus]HDR8229082.1 signal peptidase I [Bacillus cereus]HDR8415967.1 signal peptidase I [Bacillus cereus]